MGMGWDRFLSPPGRRRRVVLLGTTLISGMVGCGYLAGNDGIRATSPPSTGRPEFRFVSPQSGASITGNAIQVQLQVQAIRLVDKAGQPNVPGEGHLAVWIDTEDLSAAPTTTRATEAFEVTGLAPGLHHLIIEMRNNDGTPLAGPPPNIDLDTAVRKHIHFDTLSVLSRIQSEIFTPLCATSGCHVRGGEGPQPLTASSTSRAVLVEVPPANSTARAAGKKLVAPGRPEQSFLLQKLAGELQPGEGTRMPQDRPALAQDQIDLIQLWITQGAEPAPAIASMRKVDGRKPGAAGAAPTRR